MDTKHTLADIAENLQVWSDVITDWLDAHPRGVTIAPDLAQDLAGALAEHAGTLRGLAAEQD